METDKLALLHDHYRDTCTMMQGQRSARDRYFYLVVGIVAIALFDLATPAGFADAVAGILRVQLHLSTAPDLSYARSLLWVLLLGSTVRYCQTAIGVERLYEYIHQLEATLSTHIEGGFKREGEAYLSDYPVFLRWAHYLYTLVFPLLLSGIATVWTYRQIPGPPPWPFAVWFDCTVTVTLLASIAMYLHASHWRNSRHLARTACTDHLSSGSATSPTPEPDADMLD